MKKKVRRARTKKVVYMYWNGVDTDHARKGTKYQIHKHDKKAGFYTFTNELGTRDEGHEDCFVSVEVWEALR